MIARVWNHGKLMEAIKITNIQIVAVSSSASNVRNPWGKII